MHWGSTQRNYYIIHHERFWGKGIGQLLINMIQVISNTLYNDKDYVILLKCIDELETYSESLGFQKYKMVLNGFNFLMLDIIIMRGMQQNICILTFWTQIPSWIINKYINHAEQSLINTDFYQKFDTSIELKVHAVCACCTQFLKITKNTSCLIKETD